MSPNASSSPIDVVASVIPDFALGVRDVFAEVKCAVVARVCRSERSDASIVDGR